MKKVPLKRRRVGLLTVLGAAIVVGVGLGWMNMQLGAVLSGNPARTVMTACSGSTLLFKKNPTGNLNAWIAQYHGTVNMVVNETMQKVETPICTLANQSDAPPSVKALSNLLPPWQGKKGEGLRMADTPAVLLEHVRVYECTLREWDTFLSTNVAGELGSTATTGVGPILTFFSIPQATERLLSEPPIIARELKTARRTLHRTLLTMSSITRLAPLTQNIDCLQRASIDLRNVLGLSAEASACMPRVWDTRSPLRSTAP